MKLLIVLLLLSFSAWSQEESEAMRAMRLSCDKQKVGLGCFNYANMLIRENKSQTMDSEKYFDMGCKLGHQPACSQEKWALPEREEKISDLPEPAKKPASEPAPEETQTEASPEAALEAVVGGEESATSSESPDVVE